MEEQLFNLNAVHDVDADGVVQVRPNLWLLSSDEIPPLLFTPEETARLLGVGRPRVFELINTGVLRSVKLGASRRISARALSDCVAQLELGESA